MLKRKGKTFVFNDGEDEDREEVSVAIITDDDEANEDLSDSCVVNGGTSKFKISGSNKKMKRDKLEAAHEISIVWKDQNEGNMVEDILKGEEEDDEVENSAEPNTGETSSNLVLRKLLRGARYFDPPDTPWVSCYSCGEQGHRTVNCPTHPIKSRNPCFICGSLEHGARHCSKGHDCYICNKSGHRAKDCPDKYTSGSKGALCLRCGDLGHDMLLCNYEYSQEDLKDIQCYVCKSFGHLCCVEPGNSPSWPVSCYRCGQLGHTGLACGRHYDESNENDSVSPTCFKCGEEGHFKCERPNASPENDMEVSSCFGCGKKGHFSRECPNLSSISSTSRGRDSPSLNYKRKGARHFARECPNSSQDKLDISLTRNSHLMKCIDQLLSQ